MKLTTDFESEKKKVLIVDRHASSFTSVLKEAVKKYDNEVFISPRLPETFSKFDVFYIVNELTLLERFTTIKHKKVIFLFLNNKNKSLHFVDELVRQKLTHIKVINIDLHSELTPDDIEKILWFSFSRTTEMFLHLQTAKAKLPITPEPVHAPHRNIHALHALLKPKKILMFLGILFLLYHLLFVPPLILATFQHYQATKSLSANDWKKTESHIKNANNSLTLSKNLYSLARPTFLLLTIVIYPDNVIQLNEKVHNALVSSLSLAKEGAIVSELLLKKNKTDAEKNQILTSLSSIKSNVEVLIENLTVVYQKLPEWHPKLVATKQSIKEKTETLDSFQKFIPHLETVLGNNVERKYLLLFANNMELRPGGGFIGSYGILTVKDMSLKDLQVYDVYDADGQLSAHIDPPKPIATYLQQPHWFLRDSAFFPDYPSTYNQAIFFLNKELGLSGFDGGMLITTTAIQNILTSVGDLYVPDFKEIVNKDNFYLKAQLYAEKDFFPGSIQKKKFLASVMNQLLINTDLISLPVFFQMVKKSFDEKQIVAYFENDDVQRTVDSLYWSGKTITPQCASANQNCITDYFFPIDANLGVNKANFFVNRSFALDIRINQQGVIQNTATIKINNQSPNDVFPGGSYKNYFQVLLPKGSTVKTITRNNVLVEEFDSTEEEYLSLGFFLEIKPQSTSTIVVDYRLPIPIPAGHSAYQLVMQKQIGSANSEFTLSLTFPKNIFMVNQNFSPLVKDNNITYNSTLTADKIFFIDLIKE